MIEIIKREQPENLKRLHDIEVNQNLPAKKAYDRLRRNTKLKYEVLDSLMKEQGHLCAYCCHPPKRTTIYD